MGELNEENLQSKVRKVFLDDLPRWESGRFRGKINWKECIGSEVSFVYDGIDGKFEIVNYEKEKGLLFMNYKQEKIKISTGNLMDCRLGGILNVHTRNFKINIGELFKDNKRDLVITDREYRKEKHGKSIVNEKWYKYTCNVCGWTEGWMIENSLKKGFNCACCSNRVVVSGINDIKTTDPWMTKWISEEDAKSHTKGSGEKINVTCPDCGNKKRMRIDLIYSGKSISCTCSDGISYPEKFMTSMMSQIGINFKTQVTRTVFNWCDKRYDFYIPSLNMIIETHGIQHYEETRRNGARTLEEEHENDRLKKELALNNGIEHYIELDCRHSNLEYIKNSILNSDLSKLFDLSKIDWLKCEEFSLKNIVKEVCDYWNNKDEWETTCTIANNNEWGISGISTIIRYLKIGSELGWCNYNPKEEMMKSAKKLNKNGKQIEIFKDDNSLGVFESASELERQSEKLFGVKLYQGNISAVCLKKKSQYKGFIFRYINETYS